MDRSKLIIFFPCWVNLTAKRHKAVLLRSTRNLCMQQTPHEVFVTFVLISSRPRSDFHGSQYPLPSL